MGTRPRTFWLQTSPEFGMKRLLAAGATAIYQITRAFRGAERGPLHNPEFTMVEWYRAGDGMRQGMQLLDDLAQAMLGRGPAERLSYSAGVSPSTSGSIRCRHRRGFGWRSAPPTDCQTGAAWDPDDRDAWLDLLLVDVRRAGTRPRPTDDPVRLSGQPGGVGRRAARPDPVAERFELYVDGVELANGYHELIDPDVLRQRTRAPTGTPCRRQGTRCRRTADCWPPWTTVCRLHRRGAGLRSPRDARPGSQGPERGHGLPHRSRLIALC